MNERINCSYPGHTYRISNLDGAGTQVIQFVARPPHHEPEPGILIQDLIRICIDRVEVLNRESAAPENEHVLTALRAALLWQELRALRRKFMLGKLTELENIPTGEDGHFLFAEPDHAD